MADIFLELKPVEAYLVTKPASIGKYVSEDEILGAYLTESDFAGKIAVLSIDGSDTSWSASSDERLKENVTTSTAGLSFLNDLRPVTYNWKKKKDVPSDMTTYYEEGSDDPCMGFGKTYHGFIAQEVKTALDNHTEVENGQHLWQQDADGTQRVAPSALVPMLVKAIQEQNALIEALTTRVATLEG